MNMVELQLFESGQPVFFDVGHIALVRPASSSVGTIVILQLANRTEELHLLENYDAVMEEIRLTPMERAARSFLERREK